MPIISDGPQDWRPGWGCYQHQYQLARAYVHGLQVTWYQVMVSTPAHELAAFELEDLKGAIRSRGLGHDLRSDSRQLWNGLKCSKSKYACLWNGLDKLLMVWIRVMIDYLALLVISYWTVVSVISYWNVVSVISCWTVVSIVSYWNVVSVTSCWTVVSVTSCWNVVLVISYWTVVSVISYWTVVSLTSCWTVVSVISYWTVVSVVSCWTVVSVISYSTNDAWLM